MVSIVILHYFEIFTFDKISALSLQILFVLGWHFSCDVCGRKYLQKRSRGDKKKFESQKKSAVIWFSNTNIIY